MPDDYTNQGQIAQADFDKKVIIYWWLQALGLMLSTVILIPFIPFWLVIGYFFHQKQFDHLSCELTDRSINIRSGLLFKKQQNIPLDKITDLSIMGGPFLDSLGISKISIETAGSTPFPLTGVRNAEKFRDIVLQHRDQQASTANQPAASTTASNDVLVEIRDILHRIEAKLPGDN